MACRELVDWGLARDERYAGSRRVLFNAETDLERAIRNIVQTRKRREWDPMLEHLAGWTDELAHDADEDAVYLRGQLESVHALVQLVDDMAQRFLRGGMVERLGLELIVRATKKRRRRKKAGT